MTLNFPNTLEVWQAFTQISQIPRCSGQEAAVLEFLKNEAKSLGLHWSQDQVNNLVIRKPGSLGYEKSPTVILQGHVDMVCEKNRDKVHDFCKDPINLIIEDGWLKADGTTLGADNGIATAMALALLRDKNAIHPPLECLFTVDEETALTGALALDPGLVNGRILINLDSEDEGRFTIGCAGGLTAWGEVPLETAGTTAPGFWISLTGLKGGHSGTMIHEGRGNAVILGARLLAAAADSMEFTLWALEGGDKHNAIPREVFMGIQGGTLEFWQSHCRKWTQIFKEEMGPWAQNLEITPASKAPLSESLTAKSTAVVINLISSIPHGAATMSRAVPGLVESSSNLAAVKLENAVLKILTSMRSDRLSLRDELARKTRACFNLAGGILRTGDGYPSWTPNPDSPLLAQCLALWKKTTGQEGVVEAIHAGLECGVIGDKVPGMDMISLGPDIRDAHTPEERVSLESTRRVWEFLKALLTQMQ